MILENYTEDELTDAIARLSLDFRKHDTQNTGLIIKSEFICLLVRAGASLQYIESLFIEFMSENQPEFVNYVNFLESLGSVNTPQRVPSPAAIATFRKCGNINTQPTHLSGISFENQEKKQILNDSFVSNAITSIKQLSSLKKDKFIDFYNNMPNEIARNDSKKLSRNLLNDFNELSFTSTKDGVQTVKTVTPDKSKYSSVFCDNKSIINIFNLLLKGRKYITITDLYLKISKKNILIPKKIFFQSYSKNKVKNDKLEINDFIIFTNNLPLKYKNQLLKLGILSDNVIENISHNESFETVFTQISLRKELSFDEYPESNISTIKNQCHIDTQTKNKPNYLYQTKSSLSKLTSKKQKKNPKQINNRSKSSLNKLTSNKKIKPKEKNKTVSNFTTKYYTPNAIRNHYDISTIELSPMTNTTNYTELIDKTLPREESNSRTMTRGKLKTKVHKLLLNKMSPRISDRKLWRSENTSENFTPKPIAINETNKCFMLKSPQANYNFQIFELISLLKDNCDKLLRYCISLDPNKHSVIKIKQFHNVINRIIPQCNNHHFHLLISHLLNKPYNADDNINYNKVIGFLLLSTDENLNKISLNNTVKDNSTSKKKSIFDSVILYEPKKHSLRNLLYNPSRNLNKYVVMTDISNTNPYNDCKSSQPTQEIKPLATYKTILSPTKIECKSPLNFKDSWLREEILDLCDGDIKIFLKYLFVHDKNKTGHITTNLLQQTIKEMYTLGHKPLKNKVITACINICRIPFKSILNKNIGEASPNVLKQARQYAHKSIGNKAILCDYRFLLHYLNLKP